MAASPKNTHAGWLNLPCAMLALFLLRAPAGPLGTSIAGTLAAHTLYLVRSVAVFAGTMGAVDSLAGATEFVLSQANPVQGRVGEPLGVAFSIIATPTAPTQFVLNDELPPGLTTFPEAQDNRIRSGTPVILGTPTAAGTFVVRVTGISGPFRRSEVVTFEIAETSTKLGTFTSDATAPTDVHGAGDEPASPGLQEDECAMLFASLTVSCVLAIPVMR